jgi:peptidoglycan/LPS O-acetylase OafA/YrhL
MPNETTASRGGFIPALNGLRAIAIILVFLVHTRIYIPPENTGLEWLRDYCQIGWIGVDLFFVLSGFLITGILLDTKAAKNYFRAFYARRALRIFPLYYVVLTVVIVFGAVCKYQVVKSVLPLPQDRWVYYLYLTNWIGLWKAVWGPGYANYLAHFWSLGVEEQFYFVWPLTVWLLPRRAVIWTAAALASVAFFVRLAWLTYTGPSVAIALSTVTRMDSLFLGAIAACIYRSPELLSKLRRSLPAIAVVTLGGCFLLYTGMIAFPELSSRLTYGPGSTDRTLDEQVSLLMQGGGYTILAIGFAAVVLMAALRSEKQTWMQRFLSARGLTRIGTYSYGIYVYHVPLGGALLIFFYNVIVQDDDPHLALGLTMIAILAALTFGVAALSYEKFERPILNLKRKFEARFATASPANNHDLAAGVMEASHGQQ